MEYSPTSPAGRPRPPPALPAAAPSSPESKTISLSSPRTLTSPRHPSRNSRMYWPNDELRAMYGGDDNGLEVVPGQSHLPGFVDGGGAGDEEKDCGWPEPVMRHRTLPVGDRGGGGSGDGDGGGGDGDGARSSRRVPLGAVEIVPPSERRLWGMRMTTAALALALVLVIVVAAVGGGVGGALAVKNARTQGFQEGLAQQAGTTTTTSPPSTPPADTPTQGPAPPSSATLTIPTSGTLPLDCPGLDSTQRNISVGSDQHLFQIACGSDSPYHDMLSLVSYSLDECMYTCASLNDHADAGSAQDRCVGVLFRANLAGPLSDTCWLKSLWTGPTKVTDPGAMNSQAAARLMGG